MKPKSISVSDYLRLQHQLFQQHLHDTFTCVNALWQHFLSDKVEGGNLARFFENILQEHVLWDQICANCLTSVKSIRSMLSAFEHGSNWALVQKNEDRSKGNCLSGLHTICLTSHTCVIKYTSKVVSQLRFPSCTRLTNVYLWLHHCCIDT